MGVSSSSQSRKTVFWLILLAVLLEATLQLTWVDRSGKAAGTAGPPGVYNNFRLAPDDQRIAFDRSDAQGNQDVWVMDLIRGATSRLTFDPAIDNLPIWSPDGIRILYPNNRSGVFDLYVKAAAGAGQEEVLVKMGTPTGWGTNWSRDGRFIPYEIPGAKTGRGFVGRSAVRRSQAVPVSKYAVQ